MIRAFFTSATGMNAQQMVLDNSANNLANLNTTGFKSSQLSFEDLIYATLRPAGTATIQNQFMPTGTQLGNGVRIAGNTMNFAEGALDQTGGQLDMAIDGQGFFQITPPNGTGQPMYTRSGHFLVNNNGQVVTVDGYFLQPQLTIPQDALSISIGTDGTVSVTTASSPTTSSTVGQITLARFINPTGLSSDGNNLYSQTQASGAPQTTNPGQNGTGMIRGGYLERSNVDVVREMVNLIQAQRAYEFNTKAIQVADQMLSFTNNLVQ